MKVEVKLWCERGDDVLYTYDPATANMSEVNEMIDNLEREHAGRAFDITTGEAVEKATRDTQDVSIVRQQAGG
jgi:hypothetical protein